ncbi:hypothetical protein FKM82_024364 [Ascaphus truei]
MQQDIGLLGAIFTDSIQKPLACANSAEAKCSLCCWQHCMRLGPRGRGNNTGDQAASLASGWGWKERDFGLENSLGVVKDWPAPGLEVKNTASTVMFGQYIHVYFKKITHKSAP